MDSKERGSENAVLTSVARSGDRSWIEYHETLEARAQELGSKTRLLLLGDSITEELLGTFRGVSYRWDWREEDPIGIWKQFYEPLSALNLGVSGDRTEHLLWRLQNGELPDCLQPMSVMLAIGTNDLGTTMSPRGTAERIVNVVEYLADVRPNALIFVIALFPRAKFLGLVDPEPWRAIDETNAMLEEALKIKHEKVRFINCNSRFLKTNDAGEEVLDGRLILPDKLHLTVEGLKVWAECVSVDLCSGLESAPMISGGVSARMHEGEVQGRAAV